MRVVLDACVLLPTVMRETLLAVAAAGHFQPLWSARLLAEWESAAGKSGPAARVIARGEGVALGPRWPGAMVALGSFVAHVPEMTDPDDLHVLETAVEGGASLIVTLNLRDFPARALVPFGLTALDPDRFLYGLWSDHPASIAGAVERVRAEAGRLSGSEMPLRPLLKRAGLPRLGKALLPRDPA